MPDPTTKLFVLDTNVILHDSSCLHHFQENDVVIPITVLEELDHFKKGNDIINFHARDFVRQLDALADERLFEEGAKIGPGLGRIRIQLNTEYRQELSESFTERKPDHLILNVAVTLCRAHPDRQVILVSKDVNLRMKAKSLGIPADDYRNDHVGDISTLYPGYRRIESIHSEMIAKLYEAPNCIAPGELSLESEPLPNEYFILRNGKHSALSRMDPDSGMLHKINRNNAYGILPRNAEQTFALNALLDPRIKLVTIAGKAGTGKTLLALAAALEQHERYRQILQGRPIVPLGNRDIGFLPGDVKSKLDPYMQPLADNLAVIQNQFKHNSEMDRRINEMRGDDRLMLAPLAYIRGRSLVGVYFIVDEAQNLTPHEVKTIITRAGEGTKVVLTGDIFQIDHPYLDSHSNGLTTLIERMKGQHLYAHVNMVKGERSELSELASDVL
ncbi:MAG TPA: ribonuclease [Lentisphaeria bacterium]|nr:ribonuclease [Lentisphaeria bacterium]